jgi:hypothetical protein
MKWSFVKMMVGHVQASESDRTGREHFELARTVIYNLLHPSSIEPSTPAVLCRVPLLASKVIPTFYSIAISWFWQSVRRYQVTIRSVAGRLVKMFHRMS